MPPVLILVVVILSVLFIKYKWERRRLEKYINKFNGPPTIPLLGNALEFTGPPSAVFKLVDELSQQYDSPFRAWLGSKPYLVVSDPQNFQIVSQKMLDKDLAYKFMREMLSDNMFLAEVKEWKPSRQVFKAALNPTVLFDSFMNTFNRRNEELVRRLKAEVSTGQHFDLWSYLFPTSVSTIRQNAFGIDKSFPDQSLMEYCNALSESTKLVSRRIYKVWLYPQICFEIFKYFNGYTNTFKTVLEFPRTILSTKKHQFYHQNESNKEDFRIRNFLNILLDQHQRKVINDEELRDAVTGILFAGGETTAVTNCFLLLMLAMRPEVQDKVYEELREVFGEGDELPKLADLSKLNFLEQCIKETLRRFPTAPVVLRRAVEDLPLNDEQVIPAGANVLLSIVGVHHNPKLYPDPMTWNPHNFDPEKQASRPKGSFVAFSSGPRGCVGEKYAWVSMKTQVSTLLRHYKFSTDVRMEDIALDFDFLVRSIHGYNVKIEPRRINK